jgi:hypothetical protein
MALSSTRSAKLGRSDAERLDWIEKHNSMFDFSTDGGWLVWGDEGVSTKPVKGATLREALDLAMDATDRTTPPE